MRSPRSRATALIVAAAALAIGAPAARGGTPDVETPAAAQELVETYAPIVMVREEDDPPCETSREQYQPTTVEAVLDNPKVKLEQRRPRQRVRQLGTAPGVAGVAGLDADHYLNLRGNPLGRTCRFSRDFKRLHADGKAPVVIYARIAREAGRPGLVVQYWYFWYFNQFNDVHEGDWEGLQIAWDEAATAEEALNADPSGLILFQHAGGERADWDDGKVQTEGTHVVVHPAAGSHATFYNSAVYVENGEHGSGLGCDNTAAPERELRPRPVLLPDGAPRTGPFAWLSYDGHWGQREAGFNNGPTGPQTKHQWDEPFTWMEAQRSSSARMPGGSIAGPAVTSVYCGAIEGMSSLLNAKQRSPVVVPAILGGLALALLLFIGYTRWSPVDVQRLRARRSFGQVVRGARRLYGRHWRVLVPTGFAALPVVGGVQYAVGELDSRAGLAVADTLNMLTRPAATAVIAGVVIVLVRSLVETGRATGLVGSWRGMLQRFGRVVGAQLLAMLGVILLLATVVGIPFALWKFVGWAFIGQEILFKDKSIREAFRGSSAHVRGRWWHTLRPVVFFTVLGLLAGPVLSFVLIFTSLELVWINLVGSVLFALLIPYVALGMTLLYLDLDVRAEEEPARPARSWRIWHPREFGRVAPAPAG